MTKICCGQCKGSGLANLTKIMQATLDAVPKNRFVTTQWIGANIPLNRAQGATAVNNRLNFLYEHDLIDMQEVGRSKTWKRIR
jgi:hypothetical protein